MKTCPVCGETYSERIDFCFEDGAVLTLMPSALDAPVPRMALHAGDAAGGLHTGHTEEVEPPSPTVAPPVPAAAVEAPEPGTFARHDDVTSPKVLPSTTDVAPDLDAPISAAAAVEPAPPATAPLFTPDETAEDEQRRAGALPWFLASSAVFAAVIVLLWVVFGNPGGRATLPSDPVAVPADVTAPEPRPKVPVPQAPAVVAPAPAPAPPAPAPTPTPPPEPKVRVVSEDITPPPMPEPPKRVTLAPAKPTQRAETVTSPPPATPSAPPSQAVPSSPWDVPAEAAMATAEIASDPPGAVVRIDGRLRGKTPLSVRLDYGRYDVALSLDGYASVSRSIDVASSAPKFPFRLEAEVRRGPVLIAVPGWEGATLWIDGMPKGVLPLEVPLAEGTHAFEVRDGARRGTTRQRVSLEQAGLTRLTLSIQAAAP